METPDSSTVHSSTRHDTKFINHLSFLRADREGSGPRLLTFLHEYSDSIQMLTQSNLLAVKLSFSNNISSQMYQFGQHNSTTYTHTSLGSTNFTSCPMSIAFCWVIAQRVVAMPYRHFEQPIGPIFRGQESGVFIHRKLRQNKLHNSVSVFNMCSTLIRFCHYFRPSSGNSFKNYKKTLFKMLDILNDSLGSQGLSRGTNINVQRLNFIYV